MPLFARVITTQVAPGAIGVAAEQLPDARQQHGFLGFYLLTGRETGKLMTISLWNTRQDVLAVEEHAARIRSQAARSIGGAAPVVEVYEVAAQA